jgi:transposase
MRTGVSFTVSPTDRRRLTALVRDRNTPQKHVWRAEIMLLSAEGAGTMEIMRRTGKSKTCVWRWQERFAEEGVDGLLRDKTRPSRNPPLGPEVAERVVALTLKDPPGETTHWTADMMAGATGISASAVRRIWGCSPTAGGGSSFPAIPTSSPSSATSSGSTSTRRRTPSCCRWTRNRRSRRSTAPSPACR